MHCLYVPSYAECAELTQENERNKLSIAELSQSKVWVCVHWRILCMYVFIGGCGRCCLNMFISRFHPLLRSGMQRRHKSGCNGWFFYNHHHTHHSLSTDNLPAVSNTFSGLSLS